MWPFTMGSLPITVRIDVTRYERLSQPAVSHSYSDANNFEGAKLFCYALEEVMAEKLRTVGGQRCFAVSRDVYDISNLYKAGVDLPKIKAILPQKCQARGL